MKIKNGIFIITAICLLLPYSIFFLATDNQIFFLTKEDGLFETAGAIFFLLTAILFLIKFLKNKNFIFLLLSFIFLLGFCEEISWGQRIFNISTPQFYEEINRQKEINIHNLKFFPGEIGEESRKGIWALMPAVDRMFSLFWFTYCCFLPILYKLHSKTKRLLNQINFPIVPISLGVLFISNYLLSKIIGPFITDTFHNPLVEIKEYNFALLFFIVSFWFNQNSNTVT